LGALGPAGTGLSCAGEVAGTGGLPGGVWLLCAAGEEENLEEMLESHEFRREVFGDVETFLGTTVPFSVTVFSEELLLVKLGLCIVLGDEGGCSTC